MARFVALSGALAPNRKSASERKLGREARAVRTLPLLDEVPVQILMLHGKLLCYRNSRERARGRVTGTVRTDFGESGDCALGPKLRKKCRRSQSRRHGRRIH